MMKVSGDDAKNYEAIRADDYAPINRGTLISADEETGEVCWRDTPETQKTVKFGPHAIKIVRKSRYGR